MFKVSKFCQSSAFGHSISSSWYPINPTQVGFIGTLLLGMALAWFAPLLEHQSPLFNDFETFLKEFNAIFGNLDKDCIFNIKIQSLC
jgi:hypothetical protein